MLKNTARSRCKALDGALALLRFFAAQGARLALIEATGVLGIDVGWVNGNYQRIPVPQRANRVRRPDTRNGGPAPPPRARVLPASGVARHTDQAVDMYGKLLDRHRKRVEDHLDDLLKAQRHAVDRIVHRYHRLGAVLLDPDIGDAELRTRLLSIVPETQLREDQSALANWTRGDRPGALRADRRAARRAEPVRRAVSEPDDVRRRARRGCVAHAVGGAALPRTPRGGTPRRAADAPLDFAPTALQPLIRHNGETDRRRWESALFLKVHDEIQTGNLAIDGAKNFGRFEAFFLAERAVGAGPHAFWARTGFPAIPPRLSST